MYILVFWTESLPFHWSGIDMIYWYHDKKNVDSSKTSNYDGLGLSSAHDMDNLNICKSTINAERYIQSLEQYISPSRCLFQGCPYLFHQDNKKPNSAHITTVWLCSKKTAGTRLAGLHSTSVSHWKCVAHNEAQDPWLLINLSQI